MLLARPLSLKKLRNPPLQLISLFHSQTPKYKPQQTPPSHFNPKTKLHAFLSLLAAFAIAAPVPISSSKHFTLLVQQDEHVKINENTIAVHDTVLYTVIQDTGSETVRVLLYHGHIDANLKNQWPEDPFIWAAKGEHISIADALVVDSRRTVSNLKRSLYSARKHCIWRAIQSTIDHDTRQPSLERPPRRKIAAI